LIVLLASISLLIPTIWLYAMVTCVSDELFFTRLIDSVFNYFSSLKAKSDEFLNHCIFLDTDGYDFKIEND